LGQSQTRHITKTGLYVVQYIEDDAEEEVQKRTEETVQKSRTQVQSKRGLGKCLYGKFGDQLAILFGHRCKKLGNRKYKNIKEYFLKKGFPDDAEANQKYIFCGDSGEGDVIAGSLMFMDNNLRRHMKAVLIHRDGWIDSKKQKERETKIKEVAGFDKNPIIFYEGIHGGVADAATQALQHGLISKGSYRKIIHDVIRKAVSEEDYVKILDEMKRKVTSRFEKNIISKNTYDKILGEINGKAGSSINDGKVELIDRRRRLAANLAANLASFTPAEARRLGTFPPFEALVRLIESEISKTVNV